MNDLIRPLVACSRQKEEEEEEEAGTCCFFRQNGCEGVSEPSLSVSLALSLSLSLSFQGQQQRPWLEEGKRGRRSKESRRTFSLSFSLSMSLLSLSFQTKSSNGVRRPFFITALESVPIPLPFDREEHALK
jgi:hypothetical protein